MALRTRTVTVATSAVQLNSTDSGVANRRTINVYNLGAAIVYLGASNVATTTGYPVAVTTGQSPTIELDPGEELWAIATGSNDVRVMENLRTVPVPVH